LKQRVTPMKLRRPDAERQAAAGFTADRIHLLVMWLRDLSRYNDWLRA
jgi:hypothetical protein